MKKTKIICTMGPNTNDETLMRKLVQNGMDIARFNFSHGDHEEQKGRMDMLKKIREEENKPIAILLDTKGPEIRTGVLKDGKKVQLEAGETFTLTTDEIVGDNKIVSITYKGLVEDVKAGSTILIDDGLIELKVKDKKGNNINCEIVNGGELGEKKGVNVPNVAIRLPAITDKDRDDLKFGVEQGVDFIAASFVRNAACIEEIKHLLWEHGSDIPVIAKIENAEGIANIDDIIRVADGIMVARGDLGVEMPAEEVPLIQKDIIKKCNKLGKPVIVATQMLETMTSNPRPTRAEASDVANAIFDGADAIMLSGESANGDYPLEAVSTMNVIAKRVEQALEYKEIFVSKGFTHHNVTTTDVIAHATVQMAYELSAQAIITPTESGYTSKVVSKYRPKATIIAYTPNDRVARHLNLRWGVVPVEGKAWDDVDEMIATATAASVRQGIVKQGDKTIITSGMKFGEGNTSTIRVHTI